MNIIGINSSPRTNGNTDILVRKILEGANEKNADTNYYNLNSMKIKGCQGCYYCKSKAVCVIKDDMSKLLEEVFIADGIILCSPVYMFQMNAQAKMFTDRLLPVLNPDFSSRFNKRKKMILAYTQGNPDKKLFSSYFKATAEMFGFLGFDVVNIIVAAGLLNPLDINKQSDLLNEAKEAGKQLTEIK
ncbi:flavodoxin family protein [Candidatus Dependentiae bacterium]|nr:flavodoxin family protein [Candidatus Dependentiae bacterium]